MSKKGRHIRALKKQQKQLQKIQKRLRQAGAQLDLKESSVSDKNSQYLHPKKQIVALKKYKRELQNKSKESKTSNKIAPTQKQLSKAIQQRKSKTFTSSKIKPVYVPQESEEHKANRQVKELREKLRKQIQVTETQIPTPEVVEELIPPTPEQPIPERINTDTSFYAHAIISNYRLQLKQYPAMCEPMLGSWLDSMIAEHGEEDVAIMLQEGANDGNVVSFEIAYSTEKMTGYIAEMLNYLPEMTDWYKSEVMEQFESWEGIYD